MEPDAVLLDLNMPELNGLQVARQLRARDATKALRLVAMTGRGSWELRKKAFDAGFNEFLTKPASRDLILDALRAPQPFSAPDATKQRQDAPERSQDPAKP
jgi:CheY-like chemotaxis protein